MFSNLIEQSLGKMIPFGQEEARAAYEFLAQAKKQLGITENVALIRAQNKNANLFATWLNHKQGAPPPPVGIIITDGAVELLNKGSLQHVMTSEMKAVIGHELSHIKDGRFMAEGTRKLPIYAMPLAFIVGYYLLDKTFHKTDQDKHKKPAKALQETIKEEKQSLAQENNHEADHDTLRKAQIYDDFLRYGGMLAAAGIGLGVGLATTRHISLASEFRADRTSAWLMGEVTSSGTAIKKILESMEENIHKQCLSLNFISTSPNLETAVKKMWNRIKAYYKQEMLMLDLEYSHAHPTLQQRMAALNELKNSADFRTRLVGSTVSMIDGPLK